MQKTNLNKRECLVFRRFGGKGYSLFACLGREVRISVLSVATLTYANVDCISAQPVPTDSAKTKTSREVMLDEVAVTGSRAPLTRSQQARMVTVLERADIQQAPVQSVNDLLKYAAGVDIRQRGPFAMQTDVSLRGSTQEQITILLNGINICDPQTAHNVMDLPVQLSEIERIEVLEGPAGRVYGTSSLVGAINIVTRPGRDTSADAKAEAGSYGYAAVTARANMRKGRWNNQLSGSYARSDGYDRCKAGTLNTDFNTAKAFYQGAYDDQEVSVSWHVGLADKGWGSTTAYASPAWQSDDQYEHTNKLFAAIQAETKGERFRFRPAVYWQQNRDRYEGYRDQPEKMKYNYNRCNVYGLNLNSYFNWAAGRTAFGAELRNEDLVSGNLGEPLTKPQHICGTDRDYTLGLNRTNISLHLEHNILLPHFTLSAGFVAVKNTWSDMPFKVYPGVDASLRLGDEWKIYASYNTSLRMPSFTEMYYQPRGYQADPHLKPEEMQAVEVGTKWLTQAVQATASVFYHHGRNMIDWVKDNSLGSAAVWKSVNHTRVNSVGAEASLALSFAALLPGQHVLQSLKASYCYIHQNKDREPDIESQYALEYLRNKVTASLLTNPWGKLHLGLNMRWQERMGTYTDFSGVVQRYRPYCIVDGRLSWQERAWDVYVEANNIFNKSYRDYGNVPQPGTWIVGGIAVRL